MNSPSFASSLAMPVVTSDPQIPSSAADLLDEVLGGDGGGTFD